MEGSAIREHKKMKNHISNRASNQKLIMVLKKLHKGKNNKSYGLPKKTRKLRDLF